MNCKATGQSVAYEARLSELYDPWGCPDVTGSSAGGAVIENCGVNATLICTKQIKTMQAEFPVHVEVHRESSYLVGKLKFVIKANATNQVGGINGYVTQEVD